MVVLVLIAFFASPAIFDKCVLSSPTEEARQNEFPWMVHLAVHFDDQHDVTTYCGASFVDNGWLLTSASCMRYHGEALPIDNITVTMGLHNLGLRGGEAGRRQQIVPPSSVYIHPRYSYDLSYNFALIRLNEMVQQSTTATLIDLPDSYCQHMGSYTNYSSQVDSCTLATTLGWGDARPRRPYTHYERNVLHKTVLPITSYVNDCTWAQPFSEALICAGGGKRWRLSNSEEAVETCFGDVGAPLACISRRYNQWYIVGVASRVYCGKNSSHQLLLNNNNNNNDANNEPWKWTGVYGRVCAALPWIREHIPIDNPDYYVDPRRTTKERIRTTKKPRATETPYIKPDIATDSFCKTGVPRVPHARVFMPSVVGLPIVDGKIWFPVGFSLSIHCGRGYDLTHEDISEITCMPNGRWDMAASCS